VVVRRHGGSERGHRAQVGIAGAQHKVSLQGFVRGLVGSAVGQCLCGWLMDYGGHAQCLCGWLMDHGGHAQRLKQGGCLAAAICVWNCFGGEGHGRSPKVAGSVCRGRVAWYRWGMGCSLLTPSAHLQWRWRVACRCGVYVNEVAVL